MPRLFGFLIQHIPLPDFNAYSIYDIVKNFWILGVLLIVISPIFIFGVLYRYSLRPNYETWNSPVAVGLHAVTTFYK